MLNSKIEQLPAPLIKEVDDFIEFLALRNDSTRWQIWLHYIESLELAETDLSDYLRNLERYEESLARGEIKC